MLHNFEALKDQQTKKYQVRYKRFFQQLTGILAELAIEGDITGVLFVEECVGALIESAKKQVEQ